jgi:hypothetical protein
MNTILYIASVIVTILGTVMLLGYTIDIIRFKLFIRKAKRNGWGPIFIDTGGGIKLLPIIHFLEGNTIILEHRAGTEVPKYWLELDFRQVIKKFSYENNKEFKQAGTVKLLRVFPAENRLPFWADHTYKQKLWLTSSNIKEYVLQAVEPLYQFRSHTDMVKYASWLLTNRILTNEMDERRSQVIADKDEYWDA